MPRTTAGTRTSATERRALDAAYPHLISGLLVWFKADSITADDGTSVSNWIDSSGNENTATNSGSATSKPTYKTNIINSLPVVRFDGGDGMTVANESSFDIATYSIYFVGKWVSGTGAIMGKSTTSFSDGRRRKLNFRFDNSTTFKILSGADANNASVTVANAANPAIYAYRTIGNAHHIFSQNSTNTVSSTTLAESTFNNASFLIGSNFGTGTEGFNGDIAEIIIFNRTLDSQEHQLIHNYLSSKYNLSSFTPITRSETGEA